MAQAPLPLAGPSAPALQGILLVYDITNRWSFDGIDRWIKEIDEVGARCLRTPVQGRPSRGPCSEGFSLRGLSPTLSQHREGGQPGAGGRPAFMPYGILCPQACAWGPPDPGWEPAAPGLQAASTNGAGARLCGKELHDVL